MTITINVVEWVLYIVVILLALSLADMTLSLYEKYIQYRIKKEEKKSKNFVESKMNNGKLIKVVIDENVPDNEIVIGDNNGSQRKVITVDTNTNIDDIPLRDTNTYPLRGTTIYIENSRKKCTE